MLKCLCNSSYRSPGDYKLAIAMGWDVEYAHALIDLWENALDDVLDRSFTQESFEKLKEEYGRTLKARPDQEDS